MKDTPQAVLDMPQAVLEVVEGLAWAVYLDTRGPRTLEQWKVLWRARGIEIPAGAWETP